MCRYDLRIPDSEFWELTYPEIFALLNRHKEAQLRALHGPAMICSTMANVHGDGSRTWTPQDFLPGADVKPAGFVDTADEEAFARRMDLLASMTGGKITEG